MTWLIKITVAEFVILMFLLGSAMAIGKAGCGGLLEKEGFNHIRTVLVPLYILLAIWEIVLPNNVPLRLIWSVPVQVAGWLLFVSGVGVRIWAQVVLNQYWSANISFLKKHRIVRSGPYRWSRHPMYYSYGVLTIGNLLLTGNIILAGTYALYCAVSLLRIPLEERRLIEHFGVLNERFYFVAGLQANVRSKLACAIRENILFGGVSIQTHSELIRNVYCLGSIVGSLPINNEADEVRRWLAEIDDHYA